MDLRIKMAVCVVSEYFMSTFFSGHYTRAVRRTTRRHFFILYVKSAIFMTVSDISSYEFLKWCSEMLICHGFLLSVNTIWIFFQSLHPCVGIDNLK
jgi:hypothetical protein